VNDVAISLYLDTRRERADAKFPVKLRVYSTSLKKQKLYSTGYSYDELQYEKIHSGRPGKLKDDRLALQEIQVHANTVARELPSFSFTAFERKLFGNHMDEADVLSMFEKYSTELRGNGKIGTASTYELTAKSIHRYLSAKRRKSLLFDDVDVDWLTSFESYMIKDLGLSVTTVAIYLRNLRAIYNRAIDAGTAKKDLYPFGRGRYVIPNAHKVKKALDRSHIKELANCKPLTFEQERARDFWLFSYLCHGMNMKDIVLLKWGNIDGDILTYYRAKTVSTSRANLKPISLHLSEFAKTVVGKYCNKVSNASGEYVFPVIKRGDTADEIHRKVKNFTRSINQNLKKLAKTIGLPQDISTYWARHSFATHAVRMGASIELVGELLNHQDIRTTQNYFAGFGDEAKIEISKRLADLLT
jgi:site-specific recombinase XerD